MSSSVVAVQDMDDLYEAVENANEKKKQLLVLEFIGSTSYRSTCEFMKPIVESVANTYKNKADFCTVDVDKNEFKDLAKAFRVQALPTFLMIMDYQTVELIVAPDKQELIKSINKLATTK
ncbi:thioredoxin H2-1-like [Miscanthus floridulus]|uniref:thioredoxin H2-1-like n=1 Tax=Miscanthus floridulus TaxID=154761 RepID=UPI0034590C5E